MNYHFLRRSLIVIILFVSLSLVTTLVKGATVEINEVFQTESDAAYTWLKTQQDNAKLDNGERSGLVDSFEDFSGPNQPITEAFIYDQAVAAIAFLVKGDIDRSKLVLTTLANLQAEDGSWCNSYWYNGYWGAELRKHVGPALWVALAVQNYEVITGDIVTYHEMAIKAIDWSLKYQQPNGGIAGGETTWDLQGVWTNEPWTGTEHNIDAYPTLNYFASTTPSKQTIYQNAAIKVKSFLDNVVWDKTNKRFFGGYKNDTGLIDPFVPLDVNPWAVMALGLGDGNEFDYSGSIEYIENAKGDSNGVGTLTNPRYVHTLTYNDNGDLMTGYDFDWQSDGASADAKVGGGKRDADIWLEGSAFMAGAYYAKGNDAKGDAILKELAKKLGTSGNSYGGLPYCLKASNNNYWRMLQQNSVSSTGWFLIMTAKWNPFTATLFDSTPRVKMPVINLASGSYPVAQVVSISCETANAVIRYTTDGTIPNTNSPIYTKPLNISKTTVLKAVAFHNDIKESHVATSEFIIDSKVAIPVLSLASGNYQGTQKVTITTKTNDAVIKFTLDGSLPNASSLTYTNPIEIKESVTLKAIAIKDGFSNSDLVTANYVILTPLTLPQFSVASGTYNQEQKVMITTTEENAVIRYTVDGTTPNEKSLVYSSEIYVKKSATINAVVQKVGYGLSEVASVSYVINSPSYKVSFLETTDKTIIIFDGAVSWVDVHYIHNNQGQQNVRMIKNESTQKFEVEVKNTKANDIIKYSFTYMESVASTSTWENYTVGSGEKPQVTKPNADKVAGVYQNSLTITLTCELSDAKIYYILNNDPKIVSVLYSSPITISETTSISFFAVKDGYLDSEVLTINYVIEETEPIIPKMGCFKSMSLFNLIIYSSILGIIIFKRYKIK